MGDDGVTYDMYTSGLLTAMKELVARADVITPNLTEFCLLTDIDYTACRIRLCLYSSSFHDLRMQGRL